jgi:hypothetical protein
MTSFAWPFTPRMRDRLPAAQAVAIGVALALVAVLPWQRLPGAPSMPASAEASGPEWTAEDRDSWLNLGQPRLHDRSSPSRLLLLLQPGMRNLRVPPARAQGQFAPLAFLEAAVPAGERLLVWLQRFKLEGG